MEEGQIVEESENWSGKGNDNLGYRDITMQQYQKVLRISSMEMRAGFFVYSNNPNVSEKVKYFGDTRKELSRSLDVLHDILQPKFDDDMKKASKETYKKLEGKKKEYKEKTGDGLKGYWISLVDLYRELLQALCFFLERFGWLESGKIED